MTSSAELDAGAVLPGTEPPAERDRDLISARHYVHSGLADRVVVRLVPDSLGAADDLTMAYLGFAEPTRVAPVGIGKHKALGFPAWALINDPANAHHALNLVKELERLARKAKSAPGAARDGLLALASGLGRSAPHFLPTFFEQAGRIYLETGSTTYAATMFGKAREAEDVHNLTVAPERLRAVFLEFAFAGAITAKAMSSYARSLLSRHAAADAYDLFRTLCVERTKGGLPPYSGMPEDLRRLAKAANLSVPEQDTAVLRAVLDASAITKAGSAFWRSYQKPLIALATAEPEVRRRLLSFVPDSDDSHDLWLDILTRSGATEALIRPAGDVPAASAPPHGPSGWLSMIAGRRSGYHRTGRSAALLDLALAMAPRLRADGVPVDLFHGRSDVDLDLLDVCLAERVPLAQRRPSRLYLDVRRWQRQDAPGARDLAAVAADPVLRPELAAGVVRLLHDQRSGDLVHRSAVESVRSVAGLPVALNEWLTDRAQRIAAGGFGGIERHLRELAALAVPLVYVDVPSAADRVASIDLLGALTTALRGGIFDELGWPALEAGVRLLLDDQEIKRGKPLAVDVVGGGWPALVLGRGERLVVVGPDGVLVDHVARIPQDARRAWSFRINGTYVDGRLLVLWPGPRNQFGYWTDAPDHVFEVDAQLRWYSRDRPTASIPLPGGGAFTGGRALHPGDDTVPEERAVLSDGTTYWAWRRVGDDEPRWWEIDTATGETGRASLPAFLEDFVADGARLRHQFSWLRPAAPGTDHSPLGQADGLLGWRVRQEAPGAWTAERIDGERVTVPADLGQPILAVRLPGADAVRPVVKAVGGLTFLDPAGTEIGVLNPNTHRPTMAEGTVLVPPTDWWHCLRPRDEAGSRALRSVDRDQVATLLAAAVAERDGAAPVARGRLAKLFSRAPGNLADTVTAVLPAVTHPGLVEGIIGVLRHAAELHGRLAAYGALADEARHADPTPVVRGPVVSDEATATALNWMDKLWRDHHAEVPGQQSLLPDVVAALTTAAQTRSAGGELGDLTVPTTRSVMWAMLMPALPALAYRAASVLTGDDDRTALLGALDALADDALNAPGQWRDIVVKPSDPGPDRRWPVNRALPTRHGFLVLTSQMSAPGLTQWRAVQFTASAGEFRLPEGWRLVDATPWDGNVGRAWLTAFRAALAERGPVPWRQEAADDLVARTGMARSEAVLVLAGLPGIGTYDANFLRPDVRTALGLKAAEAKAARQRVRQQSDEFCYRLVAAAMPADPVALWTEGPDVAAVADLWCTRFERRAPVPDDLLVAAAKAMSTRDPAEVVSGVADPSSCTWLNTDAILSIVDHQLTAKHDDGFGHRQLIGVAEALPWLAYVLPVGSPIRGGLADAYDRAAARLRHPDFLVDFGSSYGSDDVYAVLGVPVQQDGTVIDPTDWLTLIAGAHSSRRAFLRPAALPPEHRVLFEGVAGALTFASQDVLRGLAMLADPVVRAACAVRPEDGTDPAAFWQDPTVAVPELVADAADRLRVPADAATLYLQLLALPDPTDANVARWTGWQPARLKAARAQLAGTDLVLTAKRARAGRTLFLPGAWLALKDVHLPIEEWKKPMFRFTADGQPAGPLVPAGPVADLFGTAWRRVADGDAPRYEELRTGGRR